MQRIGSSDFARINRTHTASKRPALGHLGQIEEANKALKMAIEVSAQNFEYFVRSRPAWMRPVDHDLQIEGLRKAGLTE